MLARTLAQIDSLRNGTLPGQRMILGMSAAYLRDYRARDLAGDLASFRGPVLVVRGEKDDQTTTMDVESWREAAKRGGKRNVTIQEYPGLGHLLIAVGEETGAAALNVKGRFDPTVIDEIGRFVSAVR